MLYLISCLRGLSHSVSLSPPTPLLFFLSTVGFYLAVGEPVGVSLDPYFLWITLCNPPITGRSRCRHVCAHVRSESVWNEQQQCLVTGRRHMQTQLLSTRCTDTDLSIEQTIKMRVCTSKSLRSCTDLKLMHLNIHSCLQWRLFVF